jgi:hypothetical protein
MTSPESEMPNMPRGFESWRLACEAITGLSTNLDKPGEPSRLRSYPIQSASDKDQTHLGRKKSDYNELEEMLETYQEDDGDKKMKGLVTQWKDELLRTSKYCWRPSKSK